MWNSIAALVFALIAFSCQAQKVDGEIRSEREKNYVERAWTEYEKRGGRESRLGSKVEVSRDKGKIVVSIILQRPAAGGSFAVIFDEKTGDFLTYVPGL